MVGEVYTGIQQLRDYDRHVAEHRERIDAIMRNAISSPGGGIEVMSLDSMIDLEVVESQNLENETAMDQDEVRAKCEGKLLPIRRFVGVMQEHGVVPESTLESHQINKEKRLGFLPVQREVKIELPAWFFGWGGRVILDVYRHGIHLLEDGQVASDKYGFSRPPYSILKADDADIVRFIMKYTDQAGVDWPEDK